MKMLLAASLVGLAVVVSPACGQCSSTANLIGIAAANGNNLVVQQKLDNDEEFIFYANSTGTKTLYYLGNEDEHFVTDFTEEADGSISMVDGDLTVTVRCSDQGGVTIGLDSDKVTWNMFSVSATGNVLVLGRPAYKNIFLEAFGWYDTDALALTATGPIDPDHLNVSGTNSLGQSFTITTKALGLSFNEDSAVLTWWLGVLTSDTATLPCGGVCITKGSVSTILPLIAFADEAGAIDILTQNQGDQGVLCASWDATAQSEVVDLRTDFAACQTRVEDKLLVWSIGCGSVGFLTCIGCAIPSPLSPAACKVCWLSVGCLAAGYADWTWSQMDNRAEYNRVKACACNHAIARAQGATTGSCTFSCSNH